MFTIYLRRNEMQFPVGSSTEPEYIGAVNRQWNTRVAILEDLSHYVIIHIILILRDAVNHAQTHRRYCL